MPIQKIDIQRSHRRIILFMLWASLMSTSCKKQSIYINRAKPQVTLESGNARLSAPLIHLSADTVYVLATGLVRDSGESFQIDPGTLIKVNDRISIVINRGAILEADGSAEQPVVFTSSAQTGGEGIGSGAAGGEHYWYGIRIYGNAATTGASSGSLSYVRLEFAGGNEGGLPLEQALPALLVQDVAATTTLHDIEVSYSFEVPSFGFAGGNVNVKDLVSYASLAVDFYLHQGYSGKMQNVLAYRHPYFAATSGAKGSLAGLLMEDSTTHPLISNLTVLGPGPQRSTSSVYDLASTDFTTYRVADMITTRGARFNICNAVLLGFPHTCWYVDDRDVAVSYSEGVSSITHSYFQCEDTTQPFYLDPTVFPPYKSNDLKSLVIQSANHNLFVAGFEYSGLAGALEYDIHPDPVPAAGSALLEGASFDGVFSDAFFNKVSYVGAVGAKSWLTTWTNFIPLQTRYND